jgi:N-alpha-acetyltransferase 35, NatC auxiliary subunit
MRCLLMLGLQSFVMSFQRKKPQPLVYVRTLLQSYLFKDMIILGAMSIRQVLDDDLSIVVLPCSPLLDKGYDAVEAPHDARFAIAHQMEVFRQRSSQSYLDILRAFCQNRSRVRRTLCHSIQDWETVQVDAEDIDQLLQVQIDEEPVSYSNINGGTDPAYSLPLSSWAYLYKLRLMEWIVQLGFELEIYQSDELAGMYWYLNHLAKTRAQHIERIKVFTSRSLNKQRSKPQNFTAAKEAEFTRSLSYLRLTMLDATVTWELADGLSCLYTALLRLKLVAEPERPYGSSELRYELRMKPFAPIGLPDLPPYDVFSRATEQSDVPVATLLDYADKAVSGARKGFDVLVKLDAKEAFTVGTHDRWVEATKNCKRAVIAAGIAIATVRKALNAEEADLTVLQVEIPPPDKAYHDWWIVPKISRKG